ncbi:MAG: oxidoreductase [Opitutae bacterium]|nr:oxidoreductase [Opitutae bacterium]
MSEDKSLSGKNALVIGGGSGMGAAAALALARSGAQVAVSGRREGKLREIAEGAPQGALLQGYAADVRDRGSLTALFEWHDSNFPSLDIFINAAGINIPNRTMEDLSPNDWDKVIGINLTGAYDCLRLAIERMRPRKDGLVVMINSVSGKRSNPLGGVAYNASKFGMTALGACVAEEERENGIRITNIFPGEVNTPILDQRPVPPTEEHRAGILQSEDIAAAVLMLAKLDSRAHVPELVIKPTSQSYL